MAASIPQVLLLSSVALLAGTVDAVAGGGGLLTVPALLALGLPPHVALGTNKGQSVFGSGAALARYARHGWIPLRRSLAVLPAAALGALAGAALQLRIRPEPLRPVVLALLVAAAVVVAIRPLGRPPVERTAPPHERAALLAALLIGAYDGFFGPGTGTFLIVAFSGLLALPLAQASAEAKVANFASNLGALCMLGLHGTVQWRLAMPMAAAQLLGGAFGAHLAIRGGDRWVRRVVLGVVLVLVLKLTHDLYVGR